MGKWDGIDEVVAVEAAGSFAGAAGLLGVSTSHVSRAIARLESTIHARIYNRTTRSLSLTDTGRALIGQFQQIVADRDEAIAGVSDGDEPQGHLRMTCPTALGERFIVPIVRRFARESPRLSVSIELSDRIVDLVSDGFDLAIRTGRLSDSRLIGTRIASRGLTTCAAPAYFDGRALPETVTDLNQHDCLIGSTSVWQFNFSGNDIAFRPKGRWHCNNGISVREAAIDGMGICQLPDFYVGQAINCGALLPILAACKAEAEPIWAVYPERRHLLPKVKNLIERLKMFLPGSLTEW